VSRRIAAGATYKIWDAPAPDVPPVSLVDQFGSQVTNIGIPRYFCNPATKVHNGITYTPRNPEDHLACYDIDEDPVGVGNIPIFDADQQFGESFNLDITETELLCVPSHKDYPVPALGPWGIATLGGLMILTAMFTISYARRHRAQVHSS